MNVTAFWLMELPCHRHTLTDRVMV
uniref:Uncharacterized protein n=1 Tax=Anguilla anguilla TaxID=7936 RepID=A0A0E9WCZ0_ANGAN